MKGLLLKDIFNLRKVGKQYLLILAFFVCYCFILKTPSFFPMMTIMSFSMMILTSLSYDEAAGFDKYALTLPVSREDLVRSKYLLLLLLLALGFLVGICGNFLICRFGEIEQEPLLEQLASILSVVAVFLLVYATMLPVVFKLGVEKARMTMMICYIAVFAAVFFGVRLISSLSREGNPAGRMIAENALVFLAAAVIGILLYLFGSYCISIRIIRRREW